MTRPICPIDRAVMLPSADGWTCRRNPGHVFRIEESAGARPGRGGSGGHCPSNMACPLCGEEMVLTGRGEWRCTADPRHVLEVETTYRGPLIRRNPLLNRAKGPLAPSWAPAEEDWWEEDQPTGFWLSHIGITTPLLPPPQSNAGPGDYCQPLGDIAPGGGSKAGRKRKKPPRRLKEDLWGV
ncbi:MAG: hypothetical protein ACOY93_08540 [Bacillota bacterium]